MILNIIDFNIEGKDLYISKLQEQIETLRQIKETGVFLLGTYCEGDEVLSPTVLTTHLRSEFHDNIMNIIDEQIALINKDIDKLKAK